MPRIPHGAMLTGDQREFAGESAQTADARIPETPPCQPLPDSGFWPFGFLFPELQDDPDNRLPEDENTVEKLKQLGSTMKDPGPASLPGVPVPTIYTFFGQFVDHDITLSKVSDRVKLSVPDLKPVPAKEIGQYIVNSRSPNLDLDSVYWYGSPPDRVNAQMLRIDKVDHDQGLPAGKDDYNDLPRAPKSQDPRCDRVALIGDPRNDENLVVSQLHVAFLRAHNAVVERGHSFDEARQLITQHYQWIVLDDFLGRIVDAAIVKRIRHQGPAFFKPAPGALALPLEFSVAAYRFGHSKVREQYFRFNDKHYILDFASMFGLTKFSGNLRSKDHLVDDWVIDWTDFVATKGPLDSPRPIGPKLTLLELPPEMLADDAPAITNLATRNLLRGYVLSLPTGQAVAGAMKEAGIVPLKSEQIESVAISTAQRDVLREPCFKDKTPLWFYILAEAAYYNKGWHLGPVGSTIVAEVLIEVLRRSDDSILSNPYWRPTLNANPAKFDLSDLLKVARVF
jgi:hypothetical protein